MTNPKDSGVKAAKPIENPTKEDQNEAPTEEKTTDESLNVVVHPLVLLSVVDHFNRMGKIGNQKRVVGVLLGKFLRFYVKSFLVGPTQKGILEFTKFLYFFRIVVY